MSIQHASIATGLGGLPPLSVTINPASWNATHTNGESPQDKGFEAFPAGGWPGYTYSWALIGASGLSFVGGTTSKTCTVRATGSDSSATGTLRCTVTDTLTDTAQGDATINVQFGTPP